MIAVIGKENMNWTDLDKPNDNPADAAHLRKFGAVMAAAFGILSAVAWWHDSGALPWTVLVAAAFLFAGLLTPISLAPLEKIWMALAEKMSIVMTLLILTLTFFVLITPIGLLRRLVSRDSFELSFNRQLPSYWKPVEPDGPAGRPDKPY